MTNWTFAISDIHGRLDLLNEALHTIEQFVGSQDHGTLIVCGDMVDRGPDSAGVVKKLRAGPRFENWKWHCLYGNHEDFMVAWTQQNAFDSWMIHGGFETMMSYGYDPHKPESFDPSRLRSDVEWMKQLPIFIMDDYRIFVHAGFRPAGTTAEHSTADMIWSKSHDGIDTPFMGRYVVHGHVPHDEGAFVGRHRCNLDTRAYKSGRLSIAVFEEENPGPPVKILTVQGPTKKEYRRMNPDDMRVYKNWKRENA